MRSRFSLREFALLVTLLCVTLGSWEVVDDLAMRDLRSQTKNKEAAAVAPFVVELFDETYQDQPSPREYYAWLYGWTIKLPWERPDNRPPIARVQPSLMLMVTPRIIIVEEEEQVLLHLP